ncbi:hypothetical protein B0H14DRAFT_3463944 [Mycena olivaceomarginata]|nr:hypothetical protein B0H14DRAFT_3463944 [Mycena olivaceomarginata]
MALANPGSELAYVSGSNPFYMNDDGHHRYLNGIWSYRRSTIRFDAARLKRAHELNLFQPNAIIQPDGRAVGVVPAVPSVIPTLRTGSREQKWTGVPNYLITIQGEGGAGLKTYSQFTAQPASDWHQAHYDTVSDVKYGVNSTTLGLYSFRVFVDCGYSQEKVAQSGGLPRGSRLLVSAGKSNRKRPLAADIAKTERPAKRQMISHDKENIDLSVGIMTRSQRKKQVI